MPAPDRKRRLTAFAVAMAVLIATPLAVVAADAFTDVPDSNVHHEDITWMKDAGVTLGCNPPDNTEFCPGDPVLRQQMASFMRRLAENQIVDAGTLEGATAAEITSLTASDEFESVTNLGTDIETAGEVTLDVPTSGTVIAYGNATMVIFGESTVGALGVSQSAGELGQSLSVGFLDGNGTERRREPLSPVASFSIEPGSHTFYLNAQKSSTFDTGQINVSDPRLTLVFVPGS